jgi:hypothetical protein
MVVDQTFEGGAWLMAKKAKLRRLSIFEGGP